MEIDANASARRFTMFPLTNVELWKHYKNLQANFWVAEEACISGVVSKARAMEFLEFLTATSAAETSKKIAIVGETAEWGCFLGFQTFLENVHVEAATDASLAAGVDTEPSVAELAYLAGFDAEDTPHNRLLYYYAFWAAASVALGAWKSALLHVGNQGFKELVDKVHEDIGYFKDFGAAACGTFMTALELSAAANVDLLERVFKVAVLGMACLLAVDVDEDEAARGMTNDLLRRGLELPPKPATATAPRADDDF